MSASANIKAGAAYVELCLQDMKLARGLIAAKKKLIAFGASVTKMGKKLLAVSLIAASPFAIGIKAAADFEEEMANVSTMLDQPEKYMEGFKRGITDMSIEFGEGTSTLAKGLYDILSASIPAEKAMYVLSVSAKAAKAGITDTGVAADAITTILNAYGLKAKNAGDISDWLFSVVKKGKTTFAELAPAIGMVATTASSAGVGLNEVGAAIATMTRNGVRTENAVVALNSILSTFLKPTDEAAKYARKLGFEMSSATLKSIGLKGVFDKIAKLPPDAISKLFPNVRALRGVLPALQNMKGFADDLATMQNRAGAADRAYEKMSNTLALAMARMKQVGIAIFVEVGNALSDSIKEISKSAVRYMALIREWIANNKQVVRTALKIVGAVALAGAALITIGAIGQTVAFVFGGIAAIITGIGTAFSIMGAILGAVLSPIGLVTIAIAALGAAILYYTGIGGKMISWLGEKFKQLGAFVSATFQGIKDALVAGDFTLAATILWKSLQIAWLAGINELKKLWVGFKSWYQKTTAEIFYGAISIITDSWASLKTTWTNTVSFLLDVWNIFIKNLKTAWNASQSFLQKRWLDLMGMFDSSLDVDAAKKLVDAESKMLEKEAQDELDNALKNSAAQSNKDKAAIEKERKDKQAMIEQQMGEGMKGIETDNAEAMRESQEALKKAKEEWKKALEDAKNKRAEAGKLKDQEGNNYNLDDIKSVMKGASAELDAVKGKVEVGGTFYADAARSMSAGGAAERTAKATEEIKKNTKKTNQILENQSSELVYE